MDGDYFMRRVLSGVGSILICLAAQSILMAQEIALDKNLAVRADRVISGCLEKGQCGDELTVGMESAKAQARYMRGWKLRDAKTSVGEGQQEIERVQRLMNMTKSIDYLSIDIEVDSVKDNEAIVFSRQKFSRVLKLPDGKERRRITSVTHRETWEKHAAGWKLKGFTEQDQTARWEDEPER
jgi:hypothetical protein